MHLLAVRVVGDQPLEPTKIKWKKHAFGVGSSVPAVITPQRWTAGTETNKILPVMTAEPDR